MMVDDVFEAIERQPGLSGLQLATIVSGDGAVSAAVFPACQKLMKIGKIERIGSGERGDPFRYHPILV